MQETSNSLKVDEMIAKVKKLNNEQLRINVYEKFIKSVLPCYVAQHG